MPILASDQVLQALRQRRDNIPLPFPLSKPKAKHTPSPSSTHTTIIQTALLLSRKLPCDLIPYILDHAQLWAPIINSSPTPTPGSSNLQRISSYDSPKIVASVRIPSGVKRGGVRRVRFCVVSKDQGWSDYPLDHGSYRGSWTWFEAGIIGDGEGEGCRCCCGDADGDVDGEESDFSGLRRSAEMERVSMTAEQQVSQSFVSTHSQSQLQPHSESGDHHHRHQQYPHHHHPSPLPRSSTSTSSTPFIVAQHPSRSRPKPRYKYPPLRIATNIHAGQEYTKHMVEWSCESRNAEIRRMLRELKGGCTIEVSGWAMYHGWCNYVRGVEIEVEGAVVRRL